MNPFVPIKNVLWRELRRIAKYPTYITLMVILPSVAFFYFSQLFSIGVSSGVPIGVVDMDDTPTSRQLIRMFDATPSSTVAFRPGDMLEAETMVKRGEIDAVVYIPADFEKDIMSNTQTGVVSYISGINITNNGLVGKDLQTVATTFSAGIQLQVLMKTGLSEAEAMVQLLPVSFDRHILFNPWINYGYYLLPSFMPMILMIFTLVLTIFSIGMELKNRTAGEWMAAAGGRIWPAVIGKLLPYTTVMFIMSLLMNTIMYRWIGVPLNGSIGILVLAAFMFILAYQSIGILIISVLGNLRQSLSIGGGYSVLAFSFSGLTFPLMAMEPILQKLAYIFPFTLYTEVFVDQAMRGAPVVYSVEYLGWLSLFIVVPLLVLPRLKKISSDEKYWGKL